jgi:hypothetical protein
MAFACAPSAESDARAPAKAASVSHAKLFGFPNRSCAVVHGAQEPLEDNLQDFVPSNDGLPAPSPLIDSR